MKRQSYKTTPVPFARSYWVTPGKLLAGYYPGDIFAVQRERKLRGLLLSGIRYTINLMEERERDWCGDLIAPYDIHLKKYACEMEMEITHARHPIRDLSIPAREEMIVILNEIDLNIEDNKPVYVHCLGGKGRTGTVVGCYLMRHGIADRSTVFEKIQHLRRHDPEAPHPSPESPIQRHMVMDWKKGE